MEGIELIYRLLNQNGAAASSSTRMEILHQPMQIIAMLMCTGALKLNYEKEGGAAAEAAMVTKNNL